MNGWRGRLPKLRWGLVWLASGGMLCWALQAETAEEGVRPTPPPLLPASHRYQPAFSGSVHGSSEILEAPWVPLPPAPAHPVGNRGAPSESGSAELPVAVLGQDIGTQVLTPTPVGQKSAWSPQRPAHFERIARQADQHIRRGFDLAGRRAYFSARAEFLSAVRLIAEGLDQYERTQRHTQALDRGLTALEEADDFLALRTAGGKIVDLQTITAGHNTPVLQGGRLGLLTVMEALQRYLTYAQEQLATACGQEAVGSMALHGLGKLYAAMGSQSGFGVKAAPSKAMTFYQAALLVDPYNFMAANDLGVLLAQGGWYEEARAVLEYSLRINSHPVGWRNLAIVYRQMGHYELALAAAHQWRRLRQQQQSLLHQQAQTADVVVQWVPPERFAAGPGDGLTAPSDRADVFHGGPKNANSRPPNYAPPLAKQGDFFSRSAWQEKHSPPGSIQNQPGPILSSLLRGPLSVFRQAPPGEEPGADPNRKISGSSGHTPTSDGPDRSASERASFR